MVEEDEDGRRWWKKMKMEEDGGRRWRWKKMVEEDGDGRRWYCSCNIVKLIVCIIVSNV